MPLTDDPTDLNYLTPAHAVQGERIVQPLGTNVTHTLLNRVRQYKIMEKLHQDFWQILRRDYLTTLQNRVKWTSQKENLKENDFVLIKEDNLPPGVWPMARVIELYPGADGLVRKVKVRTYKNDYVRPVQKLIRLQINESESELNNDLEIMNELENKEPMINEPEINEQKTPNDDQKDQPEAEEHG